MKKPPYTLIEWYFITGFDEIINDSDERTWYCFSIAKFIKIAILSGLGHLVWLHNIQCFTFNTKPLSNQTFHWTLLCVSVCTYVKERDRVWYDLWRRGRSPEVYYSEECLMVSQPTVFFSFADAEIVSKWPWNRKAEHWAVRVCYCKTACNWDLN